MISQEKIQEAYGQHYPLLKKYITPNGWCNYWPVKILGVHKKGEYWRPNKLKNAEKMNNDFIGKQVEFHASRIMTGNPVIGVVKEMYGDWIEIKLLKDIEGILSSFKKGEVKKFRVSLISGSIKGI